MKLLSNNFNRVFNIYLPEDLFYLTAFSFIHVRSKGIFFILLALNELLKFNSRPTFVLLKNKVVKKTRMKKNSTLCFLVEW